MPDFSKNSKAEIMSFLSGMPGGIGFAGWEGSGAKYDAPTARQSWMSAMKNPEYDEEIEKAMLTSMSHLTGGDPSNKSQMLPPKLKFLQEAKEIPPEGPFPIGLRVFNAITRK